MVTVETVQTERKGSLIEITERVKKIVTENGAKNGLVIVSTLHDDTGIIYTSRQDAKGNEDIIDTFMRIWPAREHFHCTDSAEQCAAHSKASIAKQTMDFILANSEIKLGKTQGIFFAEYCNPCQREYTVTILEV